MKMRKKNHTRNTAPLSQADKTALITFFTAIALFFISPWLGLLPLFFFLLCCLIAPFCPQWGFFLPVISRNSSANRCVALTFDDGPSPLSTPLLLTLLNQFDYKATFFVVGEKVTCHPDLTSEIIAAGHGIGNHSYRHDNFLMLKSTKQLSKDIRDTQEAIAKIGIKPLLFRPPAGISNPRLKSILHHENLQTVSFSCRAWDRGNRNINNLAGRLMGKIRPGDIVLLHDIAPDKKEDLQIWIGEIEVFFRKLREKELQVVPLEQLTGMEVMTLTAGKDAQIKSGPDL